MAPSHAVPPAEFDRVNNINYRGMWLSSRAEITQMMKQEPLDTPDGRPGARGAIVNVASNLGLLPRANTREAQKLVLSSRNWPSD
jgi:NAD(P)-dependent dehydrogenase (short-subunit alcohol dehydrogenase family)